jgi:hypothetical protein
MKIKSYYVTVTKDNLYGGSGMNRKYIVKTKEELDALLAKLGDINADIAVTSFNEDGAKIETVIK